MFQNPAVLYFLPELMEFAIAGSIFYFQKPALPRGNFPGHLLDESNNEVKRLDEIHRSACSRLPDLQDISCKALREGIEPSSGG